MEQIDKIAIKRGQIFFPTNHDSANILGMADDGKRCIFFKVRAVRCFVPCFLERRTGLGVWGKGAPRFTLTGGWRMTGSAKTL